MKNFTAIPGATRGGSIEPQPEPSSSQRHTPTPNRQQAVTQRGDGEQQRSGNQRLESNRRSGNTERSRLLPQLLRHVTANGPRHSETRMRRRGGAHSLVKKR